jgi:hypothetical protein
MVLRFDSPVCIFGIHVMLFHHLIQALQLQCPLERHAYLFESQLFVCVVGNGLTGQARRVLPGLRVGSASEGGSLRKQPFLPEP